MNDVDNPHGIKDPQILARWQKDREARRPKYFWEESVGAYVFCLIGWLVCASATIWLAIAIWCDWDILNHFDRLVKSLYAVALTVFIMHNAIVVIKSPPKF